MSLIDAACRSVLATNAAVTTLVGQRIYPDRLPAGATLPAISYSLISEVPDRYVPGVRQARVQISCWSAPAEHHGIRSPAEVTALAEAVISALSRTELQKEIGSWTVGSETYHVTGCRCTGSRRLFEHETDFYHVPCDFIIILRT